MAAGWPLDGSDEPDLLAPPVGPGQAAVASSAAAYGRKLAQTEPVFAATFVRLLDNDPGLISLYLADQNADQNAYLAVGIVCEPPRVRASPTGLVCVAAAIRHVNTALTALKMISGCESKKKCPHKRQARYCESCRDPGGADIPHAQWRDVVASLCASSSITTIAIQAERGWDDQLAALMQDGAALRSLEFSSYRLSADQAARIASEIVKNSTLTRLTLREMDSASTAQLAKGKCATYDSILFAHTHALLPSLAGAWGCKG